MLFYFVSVLLLSENHHNGKKELRTAWLHQPFGSFSTKVFSIALKLSKVKIVPGGGELRLEPLITASVGLDIPLA